MYGGIDDASTRTIDIDVARLDDVLDSLDCGPVSMMKIDIQGAELEVLKSLSPGRLAALDCLEVEALVPPDGIRPTLIEYLTFFEQSGFDLYDVRSHRAPVHTHDGETEHRRSFGVVRPAYSIAERLWEFDLILFRPLDEVVASRDGERIRRLIACLCTYNYFGEALWVARHKRTIEILGAEAAKVEGAVVQWHSKLRRSVFDRPFPGSGLARLGAKILGLGDRSRWARSQWVGFPSS
jgi:hypothetical protein